MTAVALDRKFPARVRIRAFQALTAASRAELDAIRTSLTADEHETIEAELARLRGIVEGNSS
jgi:hypothetical protein